MEYERFSWSVVWILFLGCIFSSWHFPHFDSDWFACGFWSHSGPCGWLWRAFFGSQGLRCLKKCSIKGPCYYTRHSSTTHKLRWTMIWSGAQTWLPQMWQASTPGSNALHCLMCCQFCSKFCAWPDGKVNLTWILATSWIPYGLHAHAGSVMAFDFLFVTASGLKRLTILEIFDALTCLQQAAAMAAAQWWRIGDGDWWKNSSPRWGWTFHSYRVSYRCVGQKPGCCRSQTWAGGILFDGGILPSRTYSSWHAV